MQTKVRNYLQQNGNTNASDVNVTCECIEMCPISYSILKRAQRLGNTRAVFVNRSSSLLTAKRERRIILFHNNILQCSVALLS